MKKLRFEKMNQILIVSFSSNNKKILSEFHVFEKELLINFCEYIKSQLHVNIVTDLMDRNIIDYLNVYKYLNNELKFTHSIMVVLRYFYLDIVNFLINNPSNVKITLKINDSVSSESNYELKEIKNVSEFKDFDEIRAFLETLINCSDFEKLSRVIENSKYSFIIDKIIDLNDLKQKMDSYVMATAIAYFLDNGFSETNIKNFEYQQEEVSD